MALKDKHPWLHEEIGLWLDDCDAQGYVRQVQSVEKDHGRLESRRVAVSTELDWLAERQEWAGLQAVAMVESSREIRGKTTVERRKKNRASYNQAYREQLLFGRSIETT